jgi:LmbE family N-acetylglucosaminyl deacetylase
VKTLVFFHAHPDDEAIATGGSMARAADEGHRVVLVIATNGDHGELPDDLGPDETLVDRRRAETMRSAEVLGVQRVVWLGYRDSGMTGWEQNTHPESFASAELDEAAEKLAAVLREESADVLTTYDWHGNYGHPDHIKIHHVGHRAAVLAETPAVFESTMNRNAFTRMIAAARAAGELLPGATGDDPADDFDPNGPADDGNPFGMSEDELTHAVDVTRWVERKRASIACHRSQVTDSAFFLQMPHEQFAVAFGTEWYIKKGDPPGIHGDWLFE